MYETFFNPKYENVNNNLNVNLENPSSNAQFTYGKVSRVKNGTTSINSLTKKKNVGHTELCGIRLIGTENDR